MPLTLPQPMHAVIDELGPSRTMLAAFQRQRASWRGGTLGDLLRDQPRSPATWLDAPSWQRLCDALDGDAQRIDLAVAPRVGRGAASDLRALVSRDEHGDVVVLHELARANAPADRDPPDLHMLELALTQLRKAQEVAQLGSWSLDIQTGHVSWSSYLFSLFGLPVADDPPPFPTHPDLFTEESWARLAPAIVQASTDGVPYDLPVTFIRADGAHRAGRAIGTPTVDARGKVVALTGIFQDVTEAHERHEHAERLATRVALATEAAGIGVWDWSLATGELVWDERMDALYGHDGPTSYETWLETLHEDDVRTTVAALQPCIDGHAPFDHVFRIRVDGSIRTIRALGRRTSVDGGHHIIGVNLDISRSVSQLEQLSAEAEAQRQLRRALERRSEELERSNNALQQFAYAASHDLQEPLRGVAGCAALLRRGYHGQLDDKADQLIQFMVDASGRMKDLVGDLLEFSRTTSTEVSMQRIDLTDCIHDALRLLGTSVIDSKAELAIDEPLHPVIGDHAQLTAVFQNVLSNAMKYRGSDRARIHVSTRAIDGRVRVIVRDHGIGIPAQYRERVFQIFQRLHSREEYPGTGIGLALCKSIVERHGGRIWVKTPESGGGTELQFELRSSP